MDGAVPANLWPYKEMGSTDVATKEVSSILDGKYFDFPKPTALIDKILDIVADGNSFIVDFFSGSGTTAHSVIHQDMLDSGLRKFILVQLPEICDSNSTAYRDGYGTICEIGEERIRRAGEKIRAEVDKTNEQLELGAEPKPVPVIGFRVLRVDESCLKDEYAAPEQYEQTALDLFADNAAEDALPLDLFFQVLPTFHIEYSAKIVEREIGGKVCFDVNGGQLIACFDEDVDTAALEAIVKERPRYMPSSATHASPTTPPWQTSRSSSKPSAPLRGRAGDVTFRAFPACSSLRSKVFSVEGDTRMTMESGMKRILRLSAR